MTFTVKSLFEARYNTSVTRMVNRMGSKGIHLNAKIEDEDPEFHKEQIQIHKDAIANNPEWASLMLPIMQKRLEYHQKRYDELTGKS